jgi:hypothetical protein
VLVCGDFNLTGVAWSHRDNELYPSKVTSVVDGMANNDLFQVNLIPNLTTNKKIFYFC